MSSKKNGFNWNSLAERGKLECLIKKKIEKLRDEIINILKAENNGNLIKPKQKVAEIKISIESQLDSIFSEYNIYTKSDIETKKQEFCQNIEKSFDLLLNKKALCSIEFDGYNLYMFFKALSTILPEIEIQIQNNHLYILTMDPLRIAILEISLSHKNYEFYEPGKISFNLNDLQNVLKCKNSDNSKVSLIFGAERLYITITSKKYKSQIKRKLNSIDYLQSGGINISSLNEIEYSCNFYITKGKLVYLIENFGIYSEIIEIKCRQEKICFSETGDSGSNEIQWLKSSISNIVFKGEKREVSGFFSLDFFKMISKMASLLDKSEIISFSLSEVKPLRAKINYQAIDNTTIKFFIAPRE